MVDLLPTSWASISILKRITEALATEDVATFCRNNEAPILHNLEDIKRNSLKVFLVTKDPNPAITETSVYKGSRLLPEKAGAYTTISEANAASMEQNVDRTGFSQLQ